MAVLFPPRDVADAFVKQYYTILSNSPENAHKFYAESSLLGWPESDGVITPVTTLSGINDKILSSNYKNCFAEVNTVDAQASHDGGVFVAVTGSFLEKDEVTTIFFQTFFLARQAKGFFILNDILRVFDACGSGVDDAPTVLSDASDISVLEDTVAKVSSSAFSVASAKKETPVVELASNADVAPVAPAANANVPSVVEPASNADVAPAVAPAANVNVSPAVAPSANVNVSPAVAPAAKESVPSVVAPAAKEIVPSAVAPPAKESATSSVAPAAKESATSAVAPAAKESVNSSVAPAANVNVKPVVAPASNVARKITYATVVAKTTPVSSPRAAPVIASVAPKAAPVIAPVAPKAAPVATKAAPVTPKAAPVTPKAAPVPLANGAPKPSAPLANGAPKLLVSETKVAAKSSTGGFSAPVPEARGVYLGNLPYDVTKQRVAEVLRKFGPVRRFADAVQLRKHEDGYCCAFVEFESHDSARRAVEARNVKFGEKLAYIAFKKSSYNRGSRSPTRGGYGNENQSDRARRTQRSPSSGQGAR